MRGGGWKTLFGFHLMTLGVICRSQSFMYGGWSPFEVWVRELPAALPVKGAAWLFPVKVTRILQESAQHLSVSASDPSGPRGLLCCFSGPLSALLFNSCLVKYFVKICGQNNWFSFVAQRAVCVGLLLRRLHSFPSLHGVLKKVFEKVHTPLPFFFFLLFFLMSLRLIFLHIILPESSHSILSRVFFMGALALLLSSRSRFNATSHSHFSAPLHTRSHRHDSAGG